MHRPEYDARPVWHRTGNPYFPAAARVDGQWWVLRVNNFPDHPIHTLLVDGERRFDFDDTPPGWDEPANQSAPRLSPDEATAALAPVLDFTAYGREVGQACDNMFCCG